MSAINLDLDDYFERIQWRGEIRPSLAALSGLLQAHMAHIPFENFDVLLGRPVSLDIASVQGKLVGARRGGYCFEQVTLFAAVLEALGFAPARHTARVVRFVPPDQAPRTHMFLTVPLAEGTFVVDPGLGGFAPSVPVPLTEGAVARAGDERHWMVHQGAHWMLRARLADEDINLWLSSVEADNLVDFELGNHYTATHPQSIFRQRLMLRALTQDGCITVMNRDVTLWRGRQAQTSQLADRHALRTLVQHYLGFDLPEIEQLRIPGIPEWT
jgi:N-hydroxyarylamine O-acetyltransferase